MSQYNNNPTPVQAFKEYQAIPDETFEVMEDFENFIEDELDWSEIDTPTDILTDDLAVMVGQIIHQYLMQDEKTQTLIKAGEQELLKKWVGEH